MYTFTFASALKQITEVIMGGGALIQQHIYQHPWWHIQLLHSEQTTVYPSTRVARSSNKKCINSGDIHFKVEWRTTSHITAHAYS